MSNKFTVNFKKWECAVEFCRYMDNDRPAIQLVDGETWEPIATATVNLPDVEMEEDEVAVKTYSENEGMLEALLEAGVVTELVRFEYSGFVTIPIYKLHEDAVGCLENPIKNSTAGMGV